jgi:hypothetical protein
MSKPIPLFHSQGFDATTTSAMGLAFDATCIALRLNEEADDALTKMVANEIIAFAQRGIRDPSMLSSLTIESLTNGAARTP